MTELEKNEIIESVKKQLTGDLTKDMLFLKEQVTFYASQKNAEIANALTELAMSKMPKEQSEYLNKLLYIGERRLDAVYGEANRLRLQNQTAKSLTLTKELYQHIIENFKETETARFFSFHNLLESNLYYQLYHPTKNLLQAPFDFMLYLGLHAYNLVEVRRLEEAIPVLNEAIRFNPVCADPRFELAEVYKLMHEKQKLLVTIKETLPVCMSAYALSRCYANMGYYCTELKDYESAIAFYFESMIFHNHPAIRGELQNVSQLMGKKIAPPTREEVLSAFAKYEIPNGPCEEIMHTVTSMSNQAVEKKNWQEAVFYLHVICELTNDPAAKELLKNCEKHLQESQENK
ncbi:MAG: hypothetical protein K2H93_00860 [Oscillospiraceae bacterium]|nr:hypothetical protein [Oscillospiraceae bacterium]